MPLIKFMTPDRVRLMLKRLIVCILVSFVLAAGSAGADTVNLANGDRLTGRCLSLNQGELVFQTDYAGKLTIDWSRVTGLSLDQPMVVDPGDGKPIRATIKPAGPGRVRLIREQGDREAALSALRTIVPRTAPKFSWRGEINLGAGLQQGNTDNRNLDLDARVALRWGRNRFIVGAESHRSQSHGQDTADSDLGRVEYNRFVSKRWYLAGNFLAERDKFTDIDLRLAGGVGLGVQLIDSDQTQLSLEIGPNWLTEDRAVGDDLEYLAGRWGLDFSQWLLWRSVQFYHRQVGFVRVEEPERTFIQTRTGLKFPIAYGLAATLQYNLDWDAKPQPGKDKMDAKLSASLGYHW